MRAFWFVAATVGLFALTGCGNSAGGVNLDGQVVKGGVPLTLGEDESCSLTLTSADGQSKYTTSAGPDGKFTLQQPSGAPIPAGKYKVSWLHQRAASPYTKKPAFKNSKDNAEEWDVSGSSKTFTLDIEKKG